MHGISGKWEQANMEEACLASSLTGSVHSDPSRSLRKNASGPVEGEEGRFFFGISNCARI